MIAKVVKGGRILVVDDEPVNLELLEQLLGGAGYDDLAVTADPRVVLELSREFRPDLILLDLRMPHLDGFELMRQLRRAQPDGTYLPILVLTAEVSTEVKQRALAEGATDFLHKPFDPTEVLLRIANLLETRRLHTELARDNDLLEQRIRARTAEIDRARADLTQIAHAAAHDLVEPVRMVSSCVQFLAQRYGEVLDGDAEQYVHYVVQGSARIYDLLDDLLSFAQAATATRADAPVDCQALVEQVLGQLAGRIAKAGAEVRVDPLPTVPGDPVHLAQIFHHLLDNAVKFHAGGDPHVRVGAERRDGQWWFSVADDGIGVPEEQRERIFTLFTRLHHRHEYEGNGTGLGICHRLVEYQGGRIWWSPTLAAGASSTSPSPAGSPGSRMRTVRAVQSDRQLQLY